MKFKSPTGESIYVALTSGHCAVVGDEWRDLPPILHRKALEEGCITDNMSKAGINAKVETGQTNKSNQQILVEAIKKMMESPAPGDFTTAGLPNLKVLGKAVGLNVTREEMLLAVKTIAEEPEVPAKSDEGADGADEGDADEGDADGSGDNDPAE